MKTDMKSSGIEWIRNIPADWEIKRFKYVVANANTGEAISKEYWDADGEYLLYTAGQLPIRSTYGSFPKNILTTEKDILVARNGAGSVQIPQLNSIYTDHVIRFTVKNNVCIEYIYYSLIIGMEKIVSEAIDVSLKTLSKSDWDILPLSFPGFSEQKSIAAFLDEQCGKIDAIIAEIEQQIEIIKQYKKALITETVTKGLNKTVPMKNSGIDWIGRIPAHWEVKKVKFSLESNQRVLNESTRGDYFFKYIDISSVDFEKGITCYDEMRFENAPSRARRIVKKGDTIISTVRTYLKAISRIEDDKDIIVSTGFAVLSPVKNNATFIEYYCKSDVFCSEIEKLSYGIAYPAINESVLLNIKMVLPPIKEQENIAAFLDQKCKGISGILEAKQQSIETMRMYKKSLIYEYVTGKKRLLF